MANSMMHGDHTCHVGDRVRVRVDLNRFVVGIVRIVDPENRRMFVAIETTGVDVWVSALSIYPYTENEADLRRQAEEAALAPRRQTITSTSGTSTQVKALPLTPEVMAILNAALSPERTLLQQLALAVLAGDRAAAVALVDRVQEEWET